MTGTKLKLKFGDEIRHIEFEINMEDGQIIFVVLDPKIGDEIGLNVIRKESPVTALIPTKYSKC